jgi:hypothetical protein
MDVQVIKIEIDMDVAKLINAQTIQKVGVDDNTVPI